MKAFIRCGLFLIAVAVLAACSSTQTTTTTLATRAGGQGRAAGPGDTVMAFQSTRPLPNIVGQADIFGRTVNAGSTTVRYIGTKQGRAMFERVDVAVQSNATTMSETPLIVPSTTRTNVQGQVGSTSVWGTATSTSTQVLPARGSSQYATATQPIRFSLGNGQSTVIEGKTLTVVQVNANSVFYTVK